MNPTNQAPPPEENDATKPETSGDRCAQDRSPSSDTPRMDKAAYEATARTVGKWIVPLAKARHMERLYETERKDHAFLRKTLERVIRERDALICSCPVKHTTTLRGENCDAPSCPKCGKMRIQSPENTEPIPPDRSQATTNNPDTPPKAHGAGQPGNEGADETACPVVVAVEFECDECGKYGVIKSKSTLIQYCSSCGRLSTPSRIVSVGIKHDGAWKGISLP